MPVASTCESCPSFLDVDDVSTMFRKNIGAPVCARFGHVLGKPGLPSAAQVQITTHFASSCGQHGAPKPAAAPSKPSFQVTTGDPAVKMDAMPTEADRAQVTSCSSCKNFVQPDAVLNEFGWGQGLCAATGRLILAGNYSREARVCDWRSPGTPRSSTTNIMLSPVYENAFTSSDPVKSFIKRQGQPIVDPQEYETDKPVSADEMAHGIRAWRKVMDPRGSGNSTFLPIFDIASFDDVAAAKVPQTGDDEHPEWYVDHVGAVYDVAVLWMELDETPALWGEAGTGKTELLRHMAWLMALPFERISITAGSDLDDLAGKPGARGDGLGGTETFFEMGRIPKAWQSRCVLCLDEPNTGPDEVWQFVRPLTDNSKQLVLDQDKGQRVQRNDDCYFGMAMNPAWDPKNLGAAPLADADGNRLMHIFMPLPPDAIERAILKRRCEADGWDVPDEKMDLVMNIAKEVRDLITDETLTISWGIRPQIKVARALRWFDPIKAYSIAVGDSLEPVQRDAVLDIVRSYVNP